VYYELGSGTERLLRFSKAREVELNGFHYPSSPQEYKDKDYRYLCGNDPVLFEFEKTSNRPSFKGNVNMMREYLKDEKVLSIHRYGDGLYGQRPKGGFGCWHGPRYENSKIVVTITD
jgi:hypothetical protein